MLDNYVYENVKDEKDNPFGGKVEGVGLSIQWQAGPMKVGEADEKGIVRSEANGAFIETVIDAVKTRLKFYEDSSFACMENAMAIKSLDEALIWLDARTERRRRDGVEGIHSGN